MAFNKRPSERRDPQRSPSTVVSGASAFVGKQSEREGANFATHLHDEQPTSKVYWALCAVRTVSLPAAAAGF